MLWAIMVKQAIRKYYYVRKAIPPGKKLPFVVVFRVNRSEIFQVLLRVGSEVRK
jgi:hypothetical protein